MKKKLSEVATHKEFEAHVTESSPEFYRLMNPEDQPLEFEEET